MSIKTKVVLWYALLMLAIMIAVLGFIFYAGSNISKESGRASLEAIVNDAVEDIIEENPESDKKLHEHKKEKERQNDKAADGAETVATPYPSAAYPAVSEMKTIDFDDVETYDDGVYVSIYDANGQLVYGVLPIALNMENIPGFANGKLQEFSSNGEKWASYDRAVELDGFGGLTVRGIASASQITDSIKTLLTVAVAAIPFLIALSVIGGYIITKRAFGPIKKISDTAEKIANDNDLSRRINLGKGSDEIHSLAHTFDSMFDRLQEAFENEKQFTSDASHELRTPVSVIISQCEYSIENAQNLEEAKEGLEVVLKKAEKMSALINQLLMLARTDKGHQKINKEPVDIAEIITVVAEEKISAAAKKDISVNIKADSSIIIDADETLMMRVFINLIDNAIVYGKEGGKIDIGITENDQGMVIGYVADDGIGISKEDLPHIFERFYRVDKSRSNSSESSSGLGLAMVKWIVNAHGGEIRVQSELGKGSTFVFILPANKKVITNFDFI